jgi:hypothetical protein
MSDSGKRDDGVKHLTVQNWLDPDETGRAFGEVNLATGERRAASGDGWADQFLAVELHNEVTAEIREMWEAARGLALYGWFYYPLYAIAEHQLRRASPMRRSYTDTGRQTALRTRSHPDDGHPTWPSFKRRVGWLIDSGIIAADKRYRWDAIRELRNETTHASIRHLVMPVDVLRGLDLLAAEIDALFAA